MAARPFAGDRPGYRVPGATLGLLLAGVLLGLVLHVGLGGSAHLTPPEVLREIFRGPTSGGQSANNIIVWQIRLPRALGCLLVGGMLGIVGSAFQALFRNPLADPYIVGVSSGSALGACLAIVLGFEGALWGFGRPAAGFVTGLASLAWVFTLARRRNALNVTTLLLAGVVVGSLVAALTTLVLLSAGQDTNVVLRWLLGSTSNLSWPPLGLLVVTLLLGLAILLPQARPLNALAVGEETARSLGVDTRRLTRVILVTGTAVTAVAVGTVGIIGFLGLVAPHIARRLLGVDWRFSMPGALLLGSSLLLTADVVAQNGISTLKDVLMATHLIAPAPVSITELPVGAVTALLGAPFLLVLMRRKGA